MKACTTCGKTVYSSEKMAKKQSQWIGRKGKEMRPYYSPECHCWHITSEVEQPKSFRKTKFK